MLNAVLVDDEEDICDFLKDHLAAMGFDVKVTISGEIALKLINEREVHLAVVDLRLLSAISGVDVIRHIRKTWPKAVVIAMSGYVDVGLKQESAKAGVHAYFIKPDDVQPDVFREKVEKIMEQKRLGQI